ncbi:MAG TPA: hypothetical protein VGK29_04505 [Paludibaculum sp.]|jgi:hypothetical protein
MQWRLLFVFASVAAWGHSAAALDSPTPAELLLDQARSAPIEIFADVAFRLMRANVLPPARQVEVMEEVFRRAGEARQALPMRARPLRGLAGRAELEARAYGQHLDANSLRARAVQLLASRDPRRARELFEEIPLREWPIGGCESSFVPDPLLYFQALKRVVAEGGYSAKELENREPLQLAERTLRSMTNVEEFIAVGPLLPDLGKSTGDAERITIAYAGAAKVVRAAMEQQPKCAAETTPKGWSNEEEFRALLKEIEGLKVQDREKPDWAFRALQLMQKVEDWRDVPGVAAIDTFHQRVQLWQALEDRCPPGDLHRKALEGYLSALNEPGVIRDAPAEWLVHVGYPLVRASLFTPERLQSLVQSGHPVDEAYIKLPEQLMQASPNPILAIYGQLAAMRIRVEWLALRE